jgi:A/G-specific adenine glycosylase
MLVVMPKTNQHRRRARVKQAETQWSLTKKAIAPEELTFAASVVAWYREHGRQDLPWQQSDDPYHRWVSEIMLQQTQVVTVIPYYCRFIDRFPDLQSLAKARADDVLDHWTGLGYYARARNLHRAAQAIMRDHDGAFPGTFEDVVALPGIGRSTAGAILAFSFRRSYPILDGNVRRVLARYHAIDGWPGKADVARRLWAVAEIHTPDEDVGDYTQAMMDIGAEVCLRRQPRCGACPLASGCKSHNQGNPEQYPTLRPRRTRRRRVTTMVMARDHLGRVLLERRPAAGIWGGLWSFPECPARQSPERWFQKQFGLEIKSDAPWDSVSHGFTHLKLEIRPLPAKLVGTAIIVESLDRVWYKPGSSLGRGVAAPVQRLLERLQEHPL